MPRTTCISAILFAAFSFASAEVPPTCDSLDESWYFPNDCDFSCQDLESRMDPKRSRNVNGDLKCYCEGREQPFCHDNPLCRDLSIFPTSAESDCERVCGEESSSSSEASIGVDFNGYQFHYVLSCSCDGQTRCGGTKGDYVLFSDTDYMWSCTRGRTINSRRINTATDCDTFCTGTQVFSGGNFTQTNQGKTCACLHDDITSDRPGINQAVACDDATARYNDASGLGDPCYDEVGVNVIECDYTESSAATKSPKASKAHTKTLVSSTAIITGAWLMPW